MRIAILAFLLSECSAVITILGDKKVYTAINIKAAFNNIFMLDIFQKYYGIVVYDRVYIYVMIAWGFIAALGHFQYVITTPFDQSHSVLPRAVHSTYLVYFTVGGQSVLQYWRNLLVSMYRLICRGMLINLWKYNFLTKRLELLGIVVEGR